MPYHLNIQEVLLCGERAENGNVSELCTCILVFIYVLTHSQIFIGGSLCVRIVPSFLDLIPKHTMGKEGGDANCEVSARGLLQVRLGDHSQMVDTFSKVQVLWAQFPCGQPICRK